MGVSAFFLGAAAGLTGISPQAAAGPYIEFMLGYVPEKTLATAAVLAFWASLMAVAGWELASDGSLPYTLGIWTAVGAIVGVAVAARIPQSAMIIRVLRSVVVFALLFVVVEGVRARFGGQRFAGWEFLGDWRGWLLVGGGSGVLAQALRLPLAIFLVPALAFLPGLPAAHALVTSLLVAVLASVLPLAVYRGRGLVDPLVGPSMAIGGALGGATGGVLLAVLANERATWPLASFGATAMVLCAWLTYRSS